MICKFCRSDFHEQCPEAARQADEKLGELEKIASQLCYCHHRES